MGASESANDHAEGPLTRRLRRLDPTWWWLRENFKLPSLATIAGVLASAGVWIWSQHTALERLAGKLDGLATADQVAALAGSVNVLRAQVGDQGDRLDRLERNWDDAGRVLDQYPARRRTPKR